MINKAIGGVVMGSALMNVMGMPEAQTLMN